MDLEFLRPDAQPTSAREPLLPWLTHHDEGELAVDVYETAKAIFVKTAIAGVKPEDLKLTLAADVLTIKGRRHEKMSENARQHYFTRECHWGAFSRTIILPAEIKTDKAEAIFKNGILLIKLPKKSNEIKLKIEDE